MELVLTIHICPLQILAHVNSADKPAIMREPADRDHAITHKLLRQLTTNFDAFLDHAQARDQNMMVTLIVSQKVWLQFIRELVHTGFVLELIYTAYSNSRILRPRFEVTQAMINKSRKNSLRTRLKVFSAARTTIPPSLFGLLQSPSNSFKICPWISRGRLCVGTLQAVVSVARLDWTRLPRASFWSNPLRNRPDIGLLVSAHHVWDGAEQQC